LLNAQSIKFLPLGFRNILHVTVGICQFCYNPNFTVQYQLILVDEIF
jgi:hypothetical protein